MPDRINATTRMACFIANPAKHSGSPTIYNAAFVKLGMNYCYLSFEIEPEGLADALKAIRTLDMLGANISMPHKSACVPYMDSLSPAAEMIGAVNMILHKDGKLKGYNTDGIGFIANLAEHGVAAANQKVTLVGTGGAASAIAVQYALDGAEQVHIFNKKDAFWDAGLALVARIQKSTSCKVSLQDIDNRTAFAHSVKRSDILINATSLGMGKLAHLSIVDDPTLLRPELVVADVVYHPAKTTLLQAAEAAGCKAVGGMGMLLHQAAANFMLYTGKEMPLAYIKQVMAE